MSFNQQLDVITFELNDLMERRISLLNDLNIVINLIENSSIKDLPSFQEKMNKRIANINVAIILNEDNILSVEKQLISVLVPVNNPKMLMGSVNF